MSKFFFPELAKVEALTPYRLRTTWNTGEVLAVDVEAALRSAFGLAPILDPAVFATVHIGEWGGTVEWIDSEFGADNVYAWAKEQAGQVSHEMFGDWMRRNGLSLTTAAEALGMSRLLPHSTKSHSPPCGACLSWMGGRRGGGGVAAAFACGVQRRLFGKTRGFFCIRRPLATTPQGRNTIRTHLHCGICLVV